MSANSGWTEAAEGTGQSGPVLALMDFLIEVIAPVERRAELEALLLEEKSEWSRRALEAFEAGQLTRHFGDQLRAHVATWWPGGIDGTVQLELNTGQSPPDSLIRAVDERLGLLTQRLVPLLRRAAEDALKVVAQEPLELKVEVNPYPMARQGSQRTNAVPDRLGIPEAATRKTVASIAAPPGDRKPAQPPSTQAPPQPASPQTTAGGSNGRAKSGTDASPLFRWREFGVVPLVVVLIAGMLIGLLFGWILFGPKEGGSQPDVRISNLRPIHSHDFEGGPVRKFSLVGNTVDFSLDEDGFNSQRSLHLNVSLAPFNGAGQGGFRCELEQPTPVPALSARVRLHAPDFPDSLDEEPIYTQLLVDSAGGERKVSPPNRLVSDDWTLIFWAPPDDWANGPEIRTVQLWILRQNKAFNGEVDIDDFILYGPAL